MSAEITVQSHFIDKDAAVRNIYDTLLTQLRRFGKVLEEPKKTSIHLVNNSALAGVATRKSYLLLNIKSDHKIESPRIHKAEKLSANRYHLEIKLTTVADIDHELINWLKMAYHLVPELS
jgi:hypothetical protein